MACPRRSGSTVKPANLVVAVLAGNDGEPTS